MKIKQEQVHSLCRLMLQKLGEKKLIVFKAPEEKVREALISTLQKNLDEEIELDRQAEVILEENLQSSGQELDRQKMFLMIKRKLAKDRGFVL